MIALLGILGGAAVVVLLTLTYSIIEKMFDRETTEIAEQLRGLVVPRMSKAVSKIAILMERDTLRRQEILSDLHESGGSLVVAVGSLVRSVVHHAATISRGASAVVVSAVVPGVGLFVVAISVSAPRAALLIGATGAVTLLLLEGRGAPRLIWQLLGTTFGSVAVYSGLLFSGAMGVATQLGLNDLSTKAASLIRDPSILQLVSVNDELLGVITFAAAAIAWFMLTISCVHEGERLAPFLMSWGRRAMLASALSMSLCLAARTPWELMRGTWTVRDLAPMVLSAFLWTTALLLRYERFQALTLSGGPVIMCTWLALSDEAYVKLGWSIVAFLAAAAVHDLLSARFDRGTSSSIEDTRIGQTA